MIKLHEIRELIKLVDESSINELAIENRGVQVNMKKAAREVQAVRNVEPASPKIETAFQQAAVTHETIIPDGKGLAEETDHSGTEQRQEQVYEIVSDWVGVFSSVPQAGAAPYVKIGDQVQQGAIVCLCKVEVLKLYHEIRSAVSGEIIDILVEDGQLIEYGQPLFLVKPI